VKDNYFRKNILWNMNTVYYYKILWQISQLRHIVSYRKGTMVIANADHGDVKSLRNDIQRVRVNIAY